MLKIIKPEKNDIEISISQSSIPFKTQTKDFHTYPVGTFSGSPSIKRLQSKSTIKIVLTPLKKKYKKVLTTGPDYLGMDFYNVRYK